MSQSLNQILYGPPGTGKTYNTINKAIEILDPVYFNQFKDDRTKLQERFKELLISDWESTEGQISFCTFHQSFSYEDFIEGIKPVLFNSDQVGGSLSYKIEDGIFKRLALRAASSINTQIQINTSSFFISEEAFAQNQFYKISLGNSKNEADDEIYKYCMENNVIALGWGDYIDFTGKGESEVKELIKQEGLNEFAAKAVNYFKNYLKIGNYIIVSKGNYRVRALGKVTGDYVYNSNTGLDYNHFRGVEWLLKDVDLPIDSIYQKVLSQQSIYKLDKDQLKKDFFVKQQVKADAKSTTPKDFLIIIDEINRGNVSQIFGELITLIEDDKRAGKLEAIELLLPYSKEKFSVPSNLYIIGTMNTADRSVEALDTALRRRFSFVEMPPKPDLLKDKTIGNFNLETLLIILNKRIEKLLNKDHQIGHAYFLNVNSTEDLRFIFFNKIIPLLQEYFYGDYAKIGLVLGSGFVIDREKESAVDKNKFFFAEFEHEYKDDLAGKRIWSIVSEKDLESDIAFQAAMDTLLGKAS